MKFPDCFLIAIVGLCAFGCNDRSKYKSYDKGYEAAWEGEEAPSSYWASNDEKEGFEQGANDAWMYDEGYYDGTNEKRPKYFNDPFYMDGYKDGEKDKR